MSRRTRWIGRRGVVVVVVVAVAAATGVGSPGSRLASGLAPSARRASSRRPRAPASTTPTTATSRTLTGGGVAVFDCDGDGRPDLYLAGGERPGRAVPQRQPGRRRAAVRGASPLRRPTSTAVTGAYPIDIDGDGHVDLAVLRVGETRALPRASATAGSSGRTSVGRRRRRPAGRPRSAPPGRAPRRCRRWRSATTSSSTPTARSRSAVRRQRAVPAGRRRGPRYGAADRR